MTKDFAIPPVVFPSGGSSVGGNVQQRRFPTAPFQPPRPSASSSIPFMSFDIGSAAASSATSAGPFGGTIASSSSFGGGLASFEDEEPLLDELGIHPDQIWKKTRSILNPFRINQTVHQDSDLSGPIFLYLALCLFQLLAGKIQFGVILGWIVVSSIFLYSVFNFLAGRNGNLKLHTCTSLVGYCLLPVVILSAVSLFVPQGPGPIRFVLAGVFVLWSTRACSTLVVSLTDGGEEHRGLIANLSLSLSLSAMATGSTDAARSPSSGVLQKLLLVFFISIAVLAYKAIQPPPVKLCGSPDGPPITAPRIKLRDGRHLAYKEQGVPRDEANHKIVFAHGSASCRHDNVFATLLSPDIEKGLGVYMVSFDRPGYGQSDPNPNRKPKSLALDIEELADQLSLGSKFYVIGFSMGGQATWACLKYIPHRLAGAALVAPVVNYWWKNFPSEVSKEAYYRQPRNDQWAVRVAHYAPWLIHWWNSQKWFPGSSFVTGNPPLSESDIEILFKVGAARRQHEAEVMQQGTHETLNRDMIVGFGKWEFDPMEIENVFPNKEGSVHLWQGDEDAIVPVTMQRYIAKKLPWIHYHEIPGAGHLFPHAPGMVDNIVKTLLSNDEE